MASLLTEIYVSIDGLEYTKLDLYKDEAFVMKYVKKDLQDITKVNAPYSQNFSFPATPKNKQAFGFFGNTQSIKINPDNNFLCKTYTNGQLNQKGLLKLSSVKYKNKIADNFIGSFATELISLKDRIGSDTLNDITTDDYYISWKARDVFNGIRNVGTINNTVKYYIPLISNTRVLNYDNDTPASDNVAYKTNSNPLGDKVINIGELRPAISVKSIFDLIKIKYNIPIAVPLENDPVLRDAFMWCTGTNFARKYANKFIILNQYTGIGGAVANLTDSSTTITKYDNATRVRFEIAFNTLVIGENNDKANMTVTLVKKSTNETLLEFEQEFVNGNLVVEKDIPLLLFTSNLLEFYVYVKFDRPVFWKFSQIKIKQHIFYVSQSQTVNNYNINQTGSHKLDVIQSLPNMKVIDFLTSYIKTFNMSIYDSSPQDDNLFFLTPKDLDTPAKSYTKAESDYTMYADDKEVTKSVNNPYNMYSFRHVVSNYRSNVDYKNQFGLNYGEASYPLIAPTKPNLFKIETGFSIIPPVKLNGSNIFTCYGFKSGAPKIVNNSFFRYEPNLDEPTLFIKQDNVGMSGSSLGCQTQNLSDNISIGQLISYVRSMPFSINNSKSLAFSVLRIDNIDYVNSLYKTFYSDFISRLLNSNALSQTYAVTLPSTELYLNDAGVSSGILLTSKGFRLQNDVIIGETRFEIIDASLDLTTGKGKLTLLNY